MFLYDMLIYSFYSSHKTYRNNVVLGVSVSKSGEYHIIFYVF